MDQFDPRQPLQFGEMFGPPLGVSANPPEVTVNAVNFDGTNDYLDNSADLTGTADGKQLTFSGWVKIATGGDDTTMELVVGTTAVDGTTFRVLIRKLNDRFEVWVRNSSGTDIGRLRSSADTIEVADGWVHMLCSFDLSDTNKRHIYINDVEDLASVVNYVDDSIDYTLADWSIGARPQGSVKHDGDAAEFWFDDTYIDFSSTTNRRKFISANGKPVELGGNGVDPTGSSPLIYLSGATDSWHTNLGTGGGFNEQGELTTAGTSPSD